VEEKWLRIFSEIRWRELSQDIVQVQANTASGNLEFVRRLIYQMCNIRLTVPGIRISNKAMPLQALRVPAV
jgi:hypothetical protein